MQSWRPGGGLPVSRGASLLASSTHGRAMHCSFVTIRKTRLCRGGSRSHPGRATRGRCRPGSQPPCAPGEAGPLASCLRRRGPGLAGRWWSEGCPGNPNARPGLWVVFSAPRPDSCWARILPIKIFEISRKWHEVYR